MSTKKDVLIATNSFDEPSIHDVATYIHNAGHEPIVYESDAVFDCRKELNILLNPDDRGGLVAIYDGYTLSSDTIGSAWYRRPDVIPQDNRDQLEQYYLRGEVMHLQKGLWSIVPDKHWINAPSMTNAAESKLRQLVLAREIGFTIPATVVSNNWEHVRELPTPLAIKMPRGKLPDEKGSAKIMHTMMIDTPDVLDEYAATADSFPGIFQRFIHKQRDWRTTVVGDEVISVAIYTTGPATVDWRQYQRTEYVQYRQEKIDPRTEELCVQFLRRLGLRYGAFDFVESPNSGITFLEMNPSGQFKFLEHHVENLPISRAIGAELIRIAGS